MKHLARTLIATLLTFALSLAPFAAGAQAILPPSGIVSTQDTGSTTVGGAISGAPSNGSAAIAPQGPYVSFAAITIAGIWTGTLAFEGSTNGGATWGALSCGPGAAGFQSSTPSNGVFNCLTAGYTAVRVRATAAMTGAASVWLAFSAQVAAVNVVNAYAVQYCLNSSNVAVPVSSGQCANPAQVAIAGTVPVNPAASATGGYSYAHIAAGQATTVIKAGAGTLHAVTLNSPATSTNVTTIYDNATGVGTVIAIPNVVDATVPTTLIFDLAFANGLTIITGTANGGDMTVSYK